MKKDIENNLEYHDFLNEVKERIYQAHFRTFKQINYELIDLYWDIGRIIVEKQTFYNWGKSVVENLSIDLQKIYIGVKGFSAQNLWRMRQFYLAFKDNEKLSLTAREISWWKNVIIFTKCKDENEKLFYMLTTKEYGYTKDVLTHHIENKTYQKYLLNQTNFEKTLPAKYNNQAILAIKDEYTFDFLELADSHLEKELEKSLLINIRNFLIEMGYNFCFISNQFKLIVDGVDYYIDLLLFHRELKCLIAIELKVSEFRPEFAGKMQFYLSALDEYVKLKDENPSIGIIICKDKKRTTVEFALKDSNKPIGVATYKISSKLPKNLSKYLPSSIEITKKISELESLFSDENEK